MSKSAPTSMTGAVTRRRTMRPGWLQRPLRALSRVLVGALWDVEVTGVHRLPRSGPTIVVANHLSFIDSVFLLAVLPRRLCIVGKSEYLADWRTRWLFTAAGMLPIERTGGFAARTAMAACEDELGRGEVLLVFPEGTRSHDGLLHAGHAGAAMLALRTGSPIVPVGIIGTGRIQPPGAARPRRGLPCKIRIGRPIEVARCLDRAGRRTRADHVTDRFMTAIAGLSGQQRVLDDRRPSRARLVS